MLCYDRTDLSKEIHPTKSNKSRECMICHYLFFNHRFKFQDHVCNVCHDLTMLCLNISNIGVITVKKLLIIVVLCITLTNLKQFIC